MNKVDIQTTGTLKEGKERYRSGVIPYKQMGYWEPDYRPKDTDLIAMFLGHRREGGTPVAANAVPRK